MSLEELKKLGDNIAGLRGLIESGQVENTKDREAIGARLATLETRLSDAEKAMREQSISLPGADSVKDKYNAGRAMRALLTDDWKGAELELDVHKETYKRLRDGHQARVMTTLTPSAGGFLIPEEVYNTPIAKLDPMSVCRKNGATVVKPNGWPFKVNKITGGTTAAFAAEGVAGSASDLTLAQVSLSPRKNTARSILTLEQVQYGTPQTDGIVLADLQKRLDLFEDKQVLIGTGQQGQPIGIVNTTGINTVAGAKSGKLLYADLAIAVQYLEEDEVVADNVTAILHPTNKGELYRNAIGMTDASATLANEQAGFVAGPFMTAAKFKEYTGMNLATTSQLLDSSAAATIAIVGVMEWVWIADFGGVLIGKSTEATDGTYHAFTQDLMHVKATRWWDCAVVQPVAFHVITSI